MRIIGKESVRNLKSAIVKAADAFSYVGNEKVVTSVMIGDTEHVAVLNREEYIMRRTRQRSKPVIIDSFINCAF